MKSMLKDAAILCVITLVAGCLLGLVYEVTKTPIAEAKERAKQEACQEVFEAASEFVYIDLDAEAVNAYLAEEGFQATIDEVAEAYDESGVLLGYVITVTDGEGYGGDIQFSMGVTCEGVLNAISFLSISETAGLGMKADPVLTEQLKGITATEIRYTKTGKTSEDEIDAISGATITTNAVTNGVNAGLSYFYAYCVWEGGALDE